MSNLQVKDVSDAVYAELRRRASAEGMTIRDYVLRLIERDQARPSKAEWLRRVRRLAPLPIGAAEELLADRDNRDRELEDQSRTA